MPQSKSYSRKDLIAAFRAENPDASGIDDNKIFAAIAVEDPDLAKGISELRTELKDPAKRDQAANYPSSQEQGKGGAGVETPWYARSIPEFAQIFGEATAPVHSPLKTAAALKENWPTIVQDFADLNAGSASQMSRLAKGKQPADPGGMRPVIEPALKGDLPTALGAAGGMLTGNLAMGAVGEAFTKTPAGRTNAAIRTAPEAVNTAAVNVANKVTTPEAIKVRATNNRVAAETASPFKGGMVDDALSSGVGYAVAGPTGAAAAEIANLLRQTKTFKLGKASIQDFIANWMAGQGKPVALDIPEGAVVNVPPGEPIIPNAMKGEFGVAGKEPSVPGERFRQPFTEPGPSAASKPPNFYVKPPQDRVQYADTERWLDELRSVESPEQAFQRMRAMQDEQATAGRSPVPDRGTLPGETYVGERRVGPGVGYRPAPDTGLPDMAKPTTAAPELNKWMNVKESQMMYGKNPGQRIIDEGLLGADKASTLERVTAAEKSAGAGMEQAFKKAESAGTRFNIQDQIDAAVADARKTWGKGKDQAFHDALDSIQDDFVRDSGDLKVATPSEAHAFEKSLNKVANYGGTPTDVAAFARDLRSRVNKMLKTIDGIEELKDRWGDLFEAERSLKSAIRNDARGRGTGATPPKN